MADQGFDHQTAPGLHSEGSQAFVRMLQLLFVGLRYLIVLIFVAVFFMGVFVVREHEEAMLFRFGKLVRKGAAHDGILTSGRLYWAWPYPIDEVKRIPARRPITLTSSHFWPVENPNLIDPGSATTSAAESPGLAPGQGGYALTGDTNIIHMRWAVVYRVTDAKKYYLDFFAGTIERFDYQGKRQQVAAQTGEALILQCLESAVLQEVASWSIEDVLFKARTSISDDQELVGRRELLTGAVQRRLTALLDQLEVGVEIQQVMMEHRSPDATHAAFREVNDAAHEYRTELEEARSYEQRVLAEAAGRQAEITGEAEAYRTRVVAAVEADAAYFTTVLEEYEKNPRTMLVALYSDTIREVIQQAGARYVIHAGGANQEIRLLINPEPEKPADQDETPRR